MPTDPLLQNIARHIAPGEADRAFFLSLLQQKEIPRKAFLLKEGQFCRHIFYVQSGILRAYYTDKGGRESTIMFAMEDWWITDMYCFINPQPAMLNIEAVADSHVFQLLKDDWDKLLTRAPVFEKYFRILMQNAYIREQLRVIQNLSVGAEERYQHFLRKYPLVAKQVTQKQIASYLGITPEFLSSIRSNKKK